MFFYEPLARADIASHIVVVSVPRRGFIVFLLKPKHKHKQNKGGFQSPEGDSLFFYDPGGGRKSSGVSVFQSPEGDSLFFYAIEAVGAKTLTTTHVSVPRRGFIVFLRGAMASCLAPILKSFSPPKGIHCFSTCLDSIRQRRGGISILFQSPEGDSLFFYENSK